jgi:hypothetical protein
LLESAVPVQQDGAPYRPMPNDEAARAASGERSAEVAALRTARAERQHLSAAFYTIVFAVFVVFGLCWLIVSIAWR